MYSTDLYEAARSGAVVFDRHDTGVVELRGGDRATVLHALVTNDITSLKTGDLTYAAYLTPQGRMITDLSVLETGERLLLRVEGAVAGALAVRLESLIFSEDVQVRDATADIAVCELHGPLAGTVLDRIMAEFPSAIAAREDVLGVAGFVIFVPGAESARLRARLVEAGAQAGGDELYETLRIEAGRPRFGVDMGTDTIPLEAGLEKRAISFTKGCYVGQEVIVRVMHRGHGRVARRLVLLTLSDGRVPERGASLYAGDAKVGNVTSATHSPKFGGAIALGYVHRDHATAGARLSIDGSEARVHQVID